MLPLSFQDKEAKTAKKSLKTWRLQKYFVLLSENNATMAAKEEKEKIKIARETLGKYFYDMSKTSFGTGLLGTVISYFAKGEAYHIRWELLVFSVVASVVFAILGNRVLRK